MSGPFRYRKKPVVIEAWLWDGQAHEASLIIDWIIANGTLAARYHHYDEPDPGIHIDTLEGTMVAQPGDWIIRGVANEFYPCKPAIFAVTYDRVIT